MKKEPADALGRRNFDAGLGVRLDIGVVEKRLAFLDAHKGVTDVGLAGTDRFDLTAFQLDARLVALEDVEIAQGLAIKDRLGRHALNRGTGILPVKKESKERLQARRSESVQWRRMPV